MVSIFFPPIKHGILYATAKEKRAYCMQFHGSFFVCFSSLIFWLLYHLTLHPCNGIFYGYGEVSEWFKEPVLKTGDAATHHGFESHPLRHLFRCNLSKLQRIFCFFLLCIGFNDIIKLNFMVQGGKGNV